VPRFAIVAAADVRVSMIPLVKWPTDEKNVVVVALSPMPLPPAPEVPLSDPPIMVGLLNVTLLS
jgi:hypothetical protein